MEDSVESARLQCSARCTPEAQGDLYIFGSFLRHARAALGGSGDGGIMCHSSCRDACSAIQTMVFRCIRRNVDTDSRCLIAQWMLAFWKVPIMMHHTSEFHVPYLFSDMLVVSYVLSRAEYLPRSSAIAPLAPVRMRHGDRTAFAYLRGCPLQDGRT